METRLSEREVQTINLMARGYIYKEIAASLGVAYQTTKTTALRASVKLNCHNRTAAVCKAVKLGLIELPELDEYR